MDTVLAKLEWFESLQKDRHADTTARLIRIEAEQRSANGRITKAESQLDILMTHQGDEGSVSVGQIKWYLALAVGATGGTVAFLRFIGLLK